MENSGKARGWLRFICATATFEAIMTSFPHYSHKRQLKYK